MLSKPVIGKTAWHYKSSSGSNGRSQAAIGAAILFLIWLLTCPPHRSGLDSSISSASWLSTPHQSSYAYVTLLAPNPKYDNVSVSDDEDEYFVATRVLAYQLLHSPTTASNSSIPFVVLCTPDLAKSKLERLRKDGATVKVVEKITEDWMKPGLERWRDMLSKLRIFELIEYDKVLFLDADMYISQRMDGIYTDETTKPITVKQELRVEDEGELPVSYIFSAQTYFEGREHLYPYPPGKMFSGGFFLCRPSITMFNHYLQIAKIANRFDSNAMEQNLLNYAHRKDGPMPWTEITYNWTTTWPSMKEFEAGAASLHEKWWDQTINLDPYLVQLWYKAKEDMLAYHRKPGMSPRLR